MPTTCTCQSAASISVWMWLSWKNARPAPKRWLRRTPNDFQQQFATPDTANLDALRGLILRSASFGVAGAVPLSAMR